MPGFGCNHDIQHAVMPLAFMRCKMTGPSYNLRYHMKNMQHVKLPLAYMRC